MQLRNFPWLTVDCYRSEISSFFPLSSSPAREISIAPPIAFAKINPRSYRRELLARRGSAPVDFSSSTIADTIDREKGRAAVDRRSRLPRGGGARRRCPRNGRDERERIIEHRWATTVSGVTILLSLTVFLNLVAETLPQVSDAIPLLGTTEFLHRANDRVLNRRVLSVHCEWSEFWRIETVNVQPDLRGGFVHEYLRNARARG